MAQSTEIMETLPTEFDYFESKPIQACILEEFDRYALPSTLQDGSPLDFELKGAGNLYVDLNNSKLEVKCQILNADGTRIADDAAVGPANLTLHSLFSNIEMTLCDQKITSQNALYPYRAYMETALSYAKDVSKTRLLAEGWITDTVGKFDDFRVEDAGENVGFKARQAPFRGSRAVTLYGRPHLDLWHQNLDIPPGCDIRMRFVPSERDFILKKPGANGDNYKIHIESAKLWFRTKMVSNSFLMAQETMLRQNNIRIPFSLVDMKTITIPNGVNSIDLDNLFRGPIPERLVFGMVTDSRVSGHANQNPFKFQHFDLSSLCLLVNGRQYPRTAYEPNFDTGDYLREYFGLLEGLGLDTGNKAINLTPSDWANLLPLFIFRINPAGLPSVPVVGSARLSLKFRKPTPSVITAMLFAESPAIAEIDQYRNLTLS